MFELGVLILFVVGGCWLFAALIVGLFKLTLGFFGVLFGGVFALFAVGIAALLVLPLIFVALLPVLMPVACVAALVWLIVRASRPDHTTTTAR
ncbi:MAG: hypothetical protein ACREPK_09170 [Rhodanobacteraceae bacterium]